MTCLEAQSHITAFINDQLDMATLEQFLDHVNHCSDCREELEVYYTLLTAMKLLDEDKELANQFSQELDNKLKSSAEKIRKKKSARVRKKFYFLFVLVGFVIVSSISMTTKVLPTPTPEKPSFLLGYRGVPDKYNRVLLFVDEYDEQAQNYLNQLHQLRQTLYLDFNREDKNSFLLYQYSKASQEKLDAETIDQKEKVNLNDE